jgi:DHA3 family macrolide efflux protein-like MFS transporter
MMGVKTTKSSFQHYLAFWGGQTFSLLGSMVVHFVIIWYLTILTGSPIVLAMANFFYFLPMIIAMPFAGVFSDRFDRKRLIIIADSSQAATTVILILLLGMGSVDIWLIYLFIGLRSLSQAFHQPTVNAIVPTMVPKDKLSRINGLNFLFGGIMQLLGPMLAATLLIFLTVSQALWTDVITFLVALTPLLLVSIPRVRSLEQGENKNSFRVEFIDGMRTLRMVPGIIVLLIMSMLLNFLIQPLSTLLSYYVAFIHDGTALEYALLSVGFQGGVIMGAISTSIKKQWNNKIKLTFSILVIFMIGYAALAFAPYRAFLFLIICSFVMGFVLPIVNTIYQTIIQLNIPHEKLGRFSSIDSLLSMFIMPVGAILSGPLAETFGVRGLFLICAILGVLVLGSLYFFTGIRSVNFDKKLLIEEEKIHA